MNSCAWIFIKEFGMVGGAMIKRGTCSRLGWVCVPWTLSCLIIRLHPITYLVLYIWCMNMFSGKLAWSHWSGNSFLCLKLLQIANQYWQTGFRAQSSVQLLWKLEGLSVLLCFCSPLDPPYLFRKDSSPICLMSQSSVTGYITDADLYSFP